MITYSILYKTRICNLRIDLSLCTISTDISVVQLTNNLPLCYKFQLATLTSSWSCWPWYKFQSTTAGGWASGWALVKHSLSARSTSCYDERYNEISLSTLSRVLSSSSWTSPLCKTVILRKTPFLAFGKGVATYRKSSRRVKTELALMQNCNSEKNTFSCLWKRCGHIP